jgi:hypothetical protein
MDSSGKNELPADQRVLLTPAVLRKLREYSLTPDLAIAKRLFRCGSEAIFDGVNASRGDRPNTVIDYLYVRANAR